MSIRVLVGQYSKKGKKDSLFKKTNTLNFIVITKLQSDLK